MPVIIDEVVISVDVTNAEAGGAAPAQAPVQGRQELVAECVERVLEILREREER